MLNNLLCVINLLVSVLDHMQVLKLDNNSLGAAGANYLAAILEKPSCLLRELHLFCNVREDVC